MDSVNPGALSPPPPPSSPSFRQRKGWGLSEVLFFVVLACAMAAVVYCGRFAYREALLLEEAKANGQAISRWAESMAEAHANGAALTPTACGFAAGAQDAEPATWQACRDALFGPEGPFAQMRNPFNAANTVLGTQCQRQSAATRGHVLVHKGTPPPQGVAGSMYWSPIDGKETLVKGLALRVQVCDAGGYAIKVAEVTL
ncbi:MAG: hypothetical protein RI884_2983 [Pseudomonadota bacterium]